MEGKLTPREQGDIGELSAMEWLASKGAHVFIPVGHSPDVDLIADLGDRVIRVEVKTSTHGRGDRWEVLIATFGGNQSWTGLVKYFDPERCDYLFVHVRDGRRWFIPTAVLDCRRGLTLGGPKYSEFEIERGRPLAARTAAGFLESGTARGSVEAGESSEPVKFVPMAEWVRIPPPPPRSAKPSVRPVRSERTRISARHQVTIPLTPFQGADLKVGDRFHARAEGPGRVILERIDPPGDSLPANGQPQLDLG